MARYEVTNISSLFLRDGLKCIHPGLINTRIKFIHKHSVHVRNAVWCKTNSSPICMFWTAAFGSSGLRYRDINRFFTRKLQYFRLQTQTSMTMTLAVNQPCALVSACSRILRQVCFYFFLSELLTRTRVQL